MVVDEAGQAGGAAQVDHGGVRGDGEPGPHRRDPLALDQDHRTRAHVIRPPVDQAAAADGHWLRGASEGRGHEDQADYKEHGETVQRVLLHRPPTLAFLNGLTV